MTSPVRSVASAFAILRLIAESGPATLTEIGQNLDLSPSSCLNLLRTLVDQGAIEREIGTKRYRLTDEWSDSGLFLGGRDAAVIDQLRPTMTRLARDFEATIGLWKVSPGRRLQLIAHALCNAPLRIQLADGQRQPLGGGAVGRALAAAQQVNDAELARRYSEVRWQTPLPLSSYINEVARATRLGFAIDNGAAFPGVCSIAAALGGDSPALILSVSIFAGSRTDDQIESIGRALSAAAIKRKSPYLA